MRALLVELFSNTYSDQSVCAYSIPFTQKAVCVKVKRNIIPTTVSRCIIEACIMFNFSIIIRLIRNPVIIKGIAIGTANPLPFSFMSFIRGLIG